MVHLPRRSSLSGAKLGAALDWAPGLTPAETMLLGSGAGLAVTAPVALLAAELLKHKTLPTDATKAQKQKHTTEAKKIIQFVAEAFRTRPRVFRKKDFAPSASAMDPAKNHVHVSYYGNPALLAHELGHAANVAKDKQTVLGRALSGMTNIAYSPVPSVASVAGLVGFASDYPVAGAAGVGLAGLLSLTQLVEEARASVKARKILKEIYGDKLKTTDYLVPLGAGFSTYLAQALARTGAPIAAEVIQESVR